MLHRAGHRNLIALLLAALVVAASAPALAEESPQLGQARAPDPLAERLANPIAAARFGCFVCAQGIGTMMSVLPLGAGLAGHTTSERADLMLPIFAAGALFYGFAEFGAMWMSDRDRPWEQWVAIFAVRGLATALAFVAGRHLEMGPALLVSGGLSVAAAIPLYVLEPDLR